MTKPRKPKRIAGNCLSRIRWNDPYGPAWETRPYPYNRAKQLRDMFAANRRNRGVGMRRVDPKNGRWSLLIYPKSLDGFRRLYARWNARMCETEGRDYVFTVHGLYADCHNPKSGMTYMVTADSCECTAFAKIACKLAVDCKHQAEMRRRGIDIQLTGVVLS